MICKLSLKKKKKKKHNVQSMAWVVRLQQRGDVYGYGIFLLEMFQGKRPIDKMFKDHLNLHNFAKMALPESLVQIVDPILLPREVVETLAITVAREDNNEHVIQADEETRRCVNPCQIDANVHKCLVSILDIGLAVQWSHQKKERIWRKLIWN